MKLRKARLCVQLPFNPASVHCVLTPPTLQTPSHQGPEELFETVSQALLSGQDRDCLAGWGAVVYVM
jgi:hypothetical protein